MPAWVSAAEVRARVAVPAEVDDSALDRWALVASELLSALTGTAPVLSRTVEVDGCGCDVLTGPYDRVDVGAAGTAGTSPFYWRVGTDLALGGCPHELMLPAPVVIGVQQVKVSGETAPAESYVLRGPNVLRRLTGPSWGAGLTVTFTASAGPFGELATTAAATLAVELAKAALGLKGCALPSRVTSVTRSNVSMELTDLTAALADGMTGVTIVDLFIGSTRRPARRSSVVSPDDPRFAQVRA